MTARSDSPDPQDPLLRTQWTLIERLRRWDEQESWREFFQVYWRLLHGVARKSGCTEDEAMEVVQETVISVAKEMRRGVFKMGPEFGSFKSWLLRITQRRIVDQLRKRPPPGRFVDSHASLNGDSSRTSARQFPQEDPAAAYWEREWEQHLMDTAVKRVKANVPPKHFQAFQLLVAKGLKPREVATALNTTLTQVYLYKHRVGSLVKKELRSLMEGPEL